MGAGLKSQEAVARASIEVRYPKVAAMTLLSWPDQVAAEDDLGNGSRRSITPTASPSHAGFSPISRSPGETSAPPPACANAGWP